MRGRFKLYMSPVINTFGDTFLKMFGPVINSVVKYSIVDYKYAMVNGFEKVQPLLFILIDRNGLKKEDGSYINKIQAEKNFLEYIKYVRKFGGYVDDYAENLSNLQWVVLEIPKRFKESYSHWLKGEYSKMYSKKELQEMKIYQIHKGEISPLYLILTKHPEALSNFKKVLEISYGVNQYPDNPNEYDIPPIWKDEIHNYQDDSLKLIKNYN